LVAGIARRLCSLGNSHSAGRFLWQAPMRHRAFVRADQYRMGARGCGPRASSALQEPTQARTEVRVGGPCGTGRGPLYSKGRRHCLEVKTELVHCRQTKTAAARNSEDCAEAEFYIGEWHLLAGRRTEALTALHVAAKSCPSWFIEHTAAVMELKRQGAAAEEGP
jgi:hypothetical protein